MNYFRHHFYSDETESRFRLIDAAQNGNVVYYKFNKVITGSLKLGSASCLPINEQILCLCNMSFFKYR